MRGKLASHVAKALSGGQGSGGVVLGGLLHENNTRAIATTGCSLLLKHLDFEMNVVTAFKIFMIAFFEWLVIAHRSFGVTYIAPFV